MARAEPRPTLVPRPLARVLSEEVAKPFDAVQEEAKPSDTAPSNKRKYEGLLSSYDEGYYTGADEYDSDDTVDEVNQDLFTSKILKKLLEGSLKVFEKGCYICPFDGKPKDGEKESLVQHAIAIATEDHSFRVRARHKALIKYLFPDGEDSSMKKPSKRGSKKKGKKAKKFH